MARVMDRANLQRAWRRVKANGGAPGVDGMTVDQFPAFMRAHWPAIRTAVLEGSYQPSPVRRVSIPKPAGRGERLLGIPTVTDRLICHEQKSRVARTDECVFLGFTFRGSKLRWSDRAFADFKHRVRRLTGRSRGVSMGYRLYRLAQYLRGWMAYFGISDYFRPVPEIDHWIRRRIRMCYWKQWRRARTKVRNLLWKRASARRS
jgi:RNA-directed DNA polymerase